jgi:hypothetical protein
MQKQGLVIYEILSTSTPFILSLQAVCNMGYSG